MTKRKPFSERPGTIAAVDIEYLNLIKEIRRELTELRERYNLGLVAAGQENNEVSEILPFERLKQLVAYEEADKREIEKVLWGFAIGVVGKYGLESLGINPEDAAVKYSLVVGGVCTSCFERAIKETHPSKRSELGIAEQSNLIYSPDGSETHGFNTLEGILISDAKIDKGKDFKNRYAPQCSGHEDLVVLSSRHSIQISESPNVVVDIRKKGSIDALIKLTEYYQGEKRRSDFWDKLGIRIIADRNVWPTMFIDFLMNAYSDWKTEEWRGLIRAHWYPDADAVVKTLMAGIEKSDERRYNFARMLTERNPDGDEKNPFKYVVPDSKDNPWATNPSDAKIRFIEVIPTVRQESSGNGLSERPRKMSSIEFMDEETKRRYDGDPEKKHTAYKARLYKGIMGEAQGKNKGWDGLDWTIFNRLASAYIERFQRPFAQVLYRNSRQFKDAAKQQVR